MQVQGVRPFFSDKFDITKHPQYKYLLDSSKKNAFDIAKYLSRRLTVRPDDVFESCELEAPPASDAGAIYFPTAPCAPAVKRARDAITASGFRTAPGAVRRIQSAGKWGRKSDGTAQTSERNRKKGTPCVLHGVPQPYLFYLAAASASMSMITVSLIVM